MKPFAPPGALRSHRSLLLAMECVGWLHMLGKCRAEFLREHGGQSSGYGDLRWFDSETPPFPWDDLLRWVRSAYPQLGGQNPWPGTLKKFITEQRRRDAGLLGLLQAGHGIASGIEKNLPNCTSEYLGQDATHMWLASPFGDPRRNLLADPPEALTAGGWSRLVGEVRRLLEELRQLGGDGSGDLNTWWNWRESAIGTNSLLRAAQTSTIAETRLPNNDVTVWDQSYVAAALFKSALAGAIIEGAAFPWSDGQIKNKIRWRLLTVAMGADHYEARAVRIGDWTGARLALDEFFAGARRVVEVDLAVGSLLYADGSTCVFSFPGERFDGGGAIDEKAWLDWLEHDIDALAQKLHLDTPPHCHLSEPTRSLVPITSEIRHARLRVAVPVHRPWDVTSPNASEASGHTCPVCLVRPNGAPTDKQRPCAPCRERRTHRLDAWLEGRLGDDTIWITEVADRNDRLALLTLSLDVEPWLDGSRLDALRAQAVPEWRRHNPVLRGTANPVDAKEPLEDLTRYVRSKLSHFDKSDPVLGSLQEGYPLESEWKAFFAKIVEDRAQAPSYDELDDDARARWLVHQLFRKLPAPGRVHRFWREGEAFFGRLLARFREEAAASSNRWRVRRLVLTPGSGSGSGWQDGEVYNGRLGDAPLSLLYHEQRGDFLSLCNLARVLGSAGRSHELRDKEVELRGDDQDQAIKLVIGDAREQGGRLGAYHPVIVLELNPVRFRLLVPLEAASRCVDLAIEAWKDEMGRVWDRLPLRVGVVAFSRLVPFQAVIEMARSLEHHLEAVENETWRVTDREEAEGVVCLRLVRPDGGSELRAVPVALPDGRVDVFYPYFTVSDRQPRLPLDFQHPEDGRVYRHVRDLRPGDGVAVVPSRVATVFVESTACRFEPVRSRPLADWERMRDVWRLPERAAPSQTALRGAWSEVADRSEAWCGPDGTWLPGGREAWLGLVRAVLGERLDTNTAALDRLVEAAADGTLEWAIEWHIHVLKQNIREAAYAC